MPLQRHRTTFDGIGIAWRGTVGHTPAAGPLVVVLHGLGSSSAEFTYLADLPAYQQRPLCLIDLPGYGDSDKPDGWTYAMDDQAELVAGLIRHVATGPVALVGHSMGGSIAIAVAHRHPQLVARLIVAEPNLDPGAGTLSGHIAHRAEAVFVARGYRRLVYQTRREADRGDIVARRFCRTLEQASPAALHRSAVSLRAERSPTFRSQLESLAIPRTLIWGARTPPLEPPLSDRRIAVQIIPDAGHVMMIDQPARFATAVARALAVGTSAQG